MAYAPPARTSTPLPAYTRDDPLAPPRYYRDPFADHVGFDDEEKDEHRNLFGRRLFSSATAALSSRIRPLLPPCFRNPDWDGAISCWRLFASDFFQEKEVASSDDIFSALIKGPVHGSTDPWALPPMHTKLTRRTATQKWILKEHDIWTNPKRSIAYFEITNFQPFINEWTIFNAASLLDTPIVDLGQRTILPYFCSADWKSIVQPD
jgi:hypothetical protein